jgi:CRISPR system Cascade subunit CasC
MKSMNRKNDRLYVDIHVLQTVPPSCVNRDDTGSPKTAQYGGAIRARVSSQSWKRATRLMFKEMFAADQLGIRTKKIVEMVSEKIGALDAAVDAPKAATAVLEAAGLKIKSAEDGTGALFFMSESQAKALAKLAPGIPPDSDKSAVKEFKEMARNALIEHPAIDVALFGRMVADDPSLNTDACAQVAHAISTHKVSNEYDYFTAVDDRAPEDNAGAGHIGTVEFKSSTLYRYATVAVHALHRQLGEDTAEAVGGFIRAFTCSMPTGKQNTFANRTLPDLVLVTLREDQPINLVGAFEKPVPAREEGYVEASIRRLVAHAQNIYQDFARQPSLEVASGQAKDALQNTMPLDALIDKVSGELRARLGNGGDAQ